MKMMVFFLEELSAKEMLDGLLPRLLPNGICYRCVPFEGKQDLEKQLPRKLRGWNTPNTWFIVLRDKDSGDCLVIKDRLANICQDSGKPGTLIRIACHELESWYLGDLSAVEQALAIQGLAKLQGNRKFRDPDQLANPAQELEKLTSNRYQKISGSRSIGPHLSVDDNRSHSFKVFISGVARIIEGMNSEC